MSKSTSESSAAKRRRVEQELLSSGRCTRGSLVACLVSFEKEGLLADPSGRESHRTLRKEVQHAIEHHSKATTPYGPLVQHVDLGTPQLRTWEYVNPFAFLYYLSSISLAFATLMSETVSRASSPLKMVIYIDEVKPGNPLRPDHGRGTQSIYWSFADWPQWALQRSAVWLLLGVIRTSLVDDMPGGESSLMRHLLNVCFRATSPSFIIGVLIPVGTTALLLRAVFGGFLADEKAHKEIFLVKGASGSKICTTCKNVVNRMGLSAHRPYLVGLDCCDYSLLDYHTNESFYMMVDRLREEHAAGRDIKKLEQVFGLTYDEHGLLFDDGLRSIVKPVDNCIRDWMHTMVSGGIAGTEMALLMLQLHVNGISLDTVQTFVKQYTLPRRIGKVNVDWFSVNRIAEKGDQLKSFASEQLSMIPVLYCFLVQVVAPMGIMLEHIRCFKLLRTIVEILSLGPHSAMKHVAELRAVIVEHHTLYKVLYPGSIKPKWHHLLHVPDNMVYIGVLLSCFVTERKHRTVKNAACHIFRNYEHTVLADLVNRQCEDFRTGTVLKSTMLLNPKQVRVKGMDLTKALSALLPCGEIHSRDFVGFRGRRVGVVQEFYAGDDESIVASVAEYQLVSAPVDSIVTVTLSPGLWFVSTDEIIEPLSWAPCSDGRSYMVLLPRSWHE